MIRFEKIHTELIFRAFIIFKITIKNNLKPFFETVMRR